MNGIINVYKEAGFTSHDVVARLRRILNMRKIGHTGTLDPDAVGVLPVCLGNATKVCELLTDADKEYVCELVWGVRTDTLDMSGQVVKRSDVRPARKDLDKCLNGFLGVIEQIPPMYSALKVNGRKLCDLAREGIEIERKARKIHIYELEVLYFDENGAKLRIRCSKGTYIRTLVDDIGEALGTYAAVSVLTRTRVGVFGIDKATWLADIEKAVSEGDYGFITPVDTLFTEYEAVEVGEAKRYLDNGNMIGSELLDCNKGTIRLYDNGEFRAIYRYDEALDCYICVKMFL